MQIVNAAKMRHLTDMQSPLIRWTWDSFKANMNVAKHKVSFELAEQALNDPYQLSQIDIDAYEHRFRTLASYGGTVLFIVHTEPERDPNSDQMVGRIISARKATPSERRAYHND